MAKWRRDPVIAYGVPSRGGALAHMTMGQVWYADPVNGKAGASGRSQAHPVSTLQRAVDRSAPGDLIFAAPGLYDETLTIPRSHGGKLVIATIGPRGSAFIEPQGAGEEGLICHADDVLIDGLGVAGDAAADYAAWITGARFTSRLQKFEGPDADVVRLGVGTVAQQEAGTHGDGADALFEKPEFSWGGSGLVFVTSDYGAVTQPRVEKAYFHNLTVAHAKITDTGAIGIRDLLMDECVHATGEETTEPTDFLLLNAAGSTGLIRKPTFQTDVLLASIITLAAGITITGWQTEQEGSPATGGTAGRPD